MRSDLQRRFRILQVSCLWGLSTSVPSGVQQLARSKVNAYLHVTNAIAVIIFAGPAMTTQLSALGFCLQRSSSELVTVSCCKKVLT